MENLRYHNEELNGDENFSRQLSKLGTIYVNDAFGTAHRAHASTTIIAKFFKNKKCIGALLEKEINAIDKVLKMECLPFWLYLGSKSIIKNNNYREFIRKS